MTRARRCFGISVPGVVLLVATTLAMVVAPAVAALVDPPEAWFPCPDAPAPVECALLAVPLDRSDPDSVTIHLAVRRLPADDPERRLGTLVTIAGGPGQRGTDLVYRGAQAGAVESRFDIVSWDPRGTSGETLIDCIPEWDPYRGLDRTPDDQAERQVLEARTATLVQTCRDRHGWLLPFVRTADGAHDLDALRALLGEDQLSLLGSSYGSRLALTYATLYPEHVRALVLDGYSDPNLPPWDAEVEQAGAFERSLERWLSACASDPDCLLAQHGQPDDVISALLARLDAEPVPVGTDQELSQSDAYEAIAGTLLLGSAAEERLLTALAAADDGHGAPLLALADEVRQRYRASGLTLGTFAAIECADTAATWRLLTRKRLEEVGERVRRVAPLLGPWLWSPPEVQPAWLRLCEMLPTLPAPLPGPFDAAGAGPVLVLTTAGDPTTPASAAARAPADLDEARVITVAGDHHLAYQTALSDPREAAARCVIDVVVAYLVDPAASWSVSACPVEQDR